MVKNYIKKCNKKFFVTTDLTIILLYTKIRYKKGEQKMAKKPDTGELKKNFQIKVLKENTNMTDKLTELIKKYLLK